MADYIQELEQKLEAARKRVRQGTQAQQLKSGAPLLFEIMDTEISLLVNKLTTEKPVPYDEYLDIHGKIRGVMSIRNLLDSKEVEAPQAHAEAKAIQDNLQQLKNDKK